MGRRLALFSTLLAFLGCAPSGEGPAVTSPLAQPAHLALQPDGQDFVATNAEHHLALRFDDRGAILATEETHSRLTLRGHETAVTPDVHGARVDYRHQGLDAWYINGEEGLQQGFTLHTRPDENTELVELEIDTGELTPVLVGTDVELHDVGGARFHYRDLRAFDALGEELPAAMQVRDGRIVLRVDDSRDGVRASYPLTIDPFIVAALQTLEASDAAALDEFGGTPGLTAGGPTVAVSGDVALVSATYDGGSQGGVYVFREAGGTWTEEAKLPLPAGISPTARFGYSIAVQGDIAVVGAPLPFAGTGTAYIYAHAGGTWTLTETLPGTDVGSQFGCSVALDGTALAVGARYAGTGGTVTLYRLAGANAVFEDRVTGDDTVLGDDFGSAAALDGNTLLVGSVFHGGGAAYVFTESGGSWTQQQKLVASDGAPLDLFGRSVALEGDRAIVGAPHHQLTVFAQGAAYSYDRVGSVWTENAIVRATTPAARDEFAYAVAIRGDVLLSGTRLGNAGTLLNAGLAHAFRRMGTGWTDETVYARPGGAANERFGDSVALDGRTAIIGVPFASTTASRAGAAELLRLCDDCAIDGACIADGTANPANPCEECNVAMNRSGWSNRSDGAACDDGAFCTTGDQCMAGRCTGSARDCSDGLACTADSCNEGADRCDNTLTSGCLIGGACVAEGTEDPANVCAHCVAATATDRYSPRVNGTLCGDASCSAGELTRAPTCQSGVCETMMPEPCPSGALCADATMCASGCTADDMCAADHHCDVDGSGMCEPDLTAGMACGRDGMCAGGALCVDGVCCNGACDGTCESCAVAGSEGTCTPYAAGTDPEDECGLACDGAGMCETPMDAGVDAGNDAGVEDAGSTDAGSTDAGLNDAGSTDGGATDASVEDAGTGDASVDGGADAAMSDTGATDAAPDAGDSGMPVGGVSGGSTCTVQPAGELPKGWSITWLAIGALLMVRRRRRS